MEKMKIEELRIGNYVNIVTMDNTCVITGLRKQKVSDGFYYSVIVNDQKENHFLLNHIIPIPLSEDILINAGFEKMGVTNLSLQRFNRDKITISKVNNSGKFYFRWDISNSQRMEVQYVHQLQNLIFMLTNQELIINLTPSK